MKISYYIKKYRKKNRNQSKVDWSVWRKKLPEHNVNVIYKSHYWNKFWIRPWKNRISTVASYILDFTSFPDVHCKRYGSSFCDTRIVLHRNCFIGQLIVWILSVNSCLMKLQKHLLMTHTIKSCKLNYFNLRSIRKLFKIILNLKKSRTKSPRKKQCILKVFRRKLEWQNKI